LVLSRISRQDQDNTKIVLVSRATLMEANNVRIESGYEKIEKRMEKILQRVKRRKRLTGEGKRLTEVWM